MTVAVRMCCSWRSAANVAKLRSRYSALLRTKPAARRNCITREKAPPWVNASQEHPIRVRDVGSALQISKRRVADVLGQRQTHLVPTLP